MVIKNEELMSKFIKLLIFELRTLDGNRGTAEPLIKEGIKNHVKQFGLDTDCEKLIRH